jgi:hypothetical protein
LRKTEESKKMPYTKPVLTVFGQGFQARDKIIDWAVKKGISGTKLKRLLRELK